jgi:hypothetical protein
MRERKGVSTIGIKREGLVRVLFIDCVERIGERIKQGTLTILYLIFLFCHGKRLQRNGFPFSQFGELARPNSHDDLIIQGIVAERMEIGIKWNSLEFVDYDFVFDGTCDVGADEDIQEQGRIAFNTAISGFPLLLCVNDS